MKSTTLLFAVSAFFLFSACASHGVKGGGPAKSETVTLPAGSFNKISISVPADAHISTGSAPGLRVEGYANILALLRTKVADNTLSIYIENDQDISTDRDVRMDISLPALAGLDLTGSGAVSVDNDVKAQSFRMSSSGASTIRFADLHVQSFSAKMSGATDLILKGGTIQEGNFEISGSGNIRAFPVQQQSAIISISGAGSAEVQAAAKLEATVSGAGSVRYKGHPEVTRNISGMGAIQEAD